MRRRAEGRKGRDLPIPRGNDQEPGSLGLGRSGSHHPSLLDLLHAETEAAPEQDPHMFQARTSLVRSHCRVRLTNPGCSFPVWERGVNAIALTGLASRSCQQFGAQCSVRAGRTDRDDPFGL